MPWVVIVGKMPKIHDYRDKFFPRKFLYKKDAQKLAEEVKKIGAQGVKLEKIK